MPTRPYSTVHQYSRASFAASLGGAWRATKLREALLGVGDLVGGRIALLLHHRQPIDRVVHVGIVRGGERAHAAFTDAPQERGVFGVRKDRRVARGFVDHVGRGRVRQVLDRTHLGRDRQDAERLKLLERARRNEPVDAHRAPAEPAQARVHLGDARDALDAHAGVLEPARICRMRGVAQAVVHLQEYEAPHGLIDRRVRIVVLLDHEASQVRRNALSGGRHRVPQGLSVALGSRLRRKPRKPARKLQERLHPARALAYAAPPAAGSRRRDFELTGSPAYIRFILN